MPNHQIDRSLSSSLANAFGGSPTPAVQHPTPQPAAPSSDGSAAGPSIMQRLFAALSAQGDSPFKPNGGDGSSPIGKYVR